MLRTSVVPPRFIGSRTTRAETGEKLSTGPPRWPIPEKVTLPRKRAAKMSKDAKRPDQKMDQQKVIALTEYVQKLGSVERARKALEALEQLRRAA